MLPANENVAVSVIGLHGILDTLLIGLVAGGIDGETQLFGEGLNGFVGTFARTIYTRRQVRLPILGTSGIDREARMIDIPDLGCSARMYPMLYEELGPNTVVKH